MKRLFSALALVCLWALPAGAQSLASYVGAETTTETVEAEQSTIINGVDFGGWDTLATSAEDALESGSASDFALNQLRDELAGWRDTLLAAQSVNGTRISTVNAQIAALGAKPEEGETEPAAIAERRSELQNQLDNLQAPVVLAQEAYARANGLISEIDASIRASEAAKLGTRGAGPWVLSNWTTAIGSLGSSINMMFAETKARITADLREGDWRTTMPQSMLWLAGALALLIYGRRAVIELQGHISHLNTNGRGLWLFLTSLGQIIVPYAGILLFVHAAMTSEVLGYRGQMVIDKLPDASLYVIVAYWLSGRFFGGDDGTANPLDLNPDYLGKGRRSTRGIGWTLAFGAMLLAVVGQDATDTYTLLLLPVELTVAVFLFRFGQLIKRHCNSEGASSVYRNRVFAVVGQIVMLIAIAGPVLGALGYSVAFQSLIYPAVTSLALLGLILLLQRLVVDLYILVTGAPDSAGDALIPVLIGFVLLLIAVPFVALIWGAREADLLEIWTRFREGFQIGDTRISPTDFLTFALVFGTGYTLTRLLQGTLRSTVLPKTRMDIGAQNALVSGIGYLGVFLAAVAAITTAGIDLSSLAIVAGALSVGIGFGLQTIVQNFVSGIILLIERPISEGDWIEVGDQMGIVKNISVRATQIETFDRRDVIIPNADLVSGQVTNWTRGNLVGRVIIKVGVAYGTDTDRVHDILTEIIEAHPLVLMAQPPKVLFMGFGADSLDFEIRALLRDIYYILDVQSELHHQIAKRFVKEGIEIPFAQRDLWIRNPESLRSTEE